MAKYDRLAIAFFSRLWVIAMVMLVASIFLMIFTRSAHAATMLPSVFGSSMLNVQSSIIVAGTLIVGAIVAGTVFSWMRLVLRHSVVDDLPDGDMPEYYLDFDGESALPYEAAGENEEDAQLRVQAELDAAMASWEDGYDAQILRQDAGENLPGEFVGSEFIADVEAAKEQAQVEHANDLASLGFDADWEGAHAGQVKEF